MPSPGLAAERAARLLAAGVRVGCFRPPSVPDGVSRLRLTARADLADADLARLDAALAGTSGSR
jgi:8-amino-7-oxononanoate synthase